ncbi:MAG: metallophosphatase family protein [Desulfurococcales archaeon]|nr:metallophosphatase family protein [Desulfurococcales archaeon]
MARILVLSDIHGNLPALRAVLSSAQGYDEVLVLGDLVDYGPQPGEVIDELRSIGARIVRGNHDEAAGYGVDCRCGEATHWLSVWFREHVTIPLLSSNDRRFLASLPLRLNLEVAGRKGEAVHAAPRNPLYAYLHPWLSDEEACKLTSRAPLRLTSKEGDCPSGRIIVVGHTHYQFHRYVRGTLILNPGSVGQPRDGDPRAAYAVIDTSTGTVSFNRVEYPVEETIRRLRELHIPSPYIDALVYMLREARVPPPSMRP